MKIFNIPSNLQPDDYLAVIEVRYENSFAVSSDLFKVVKKEPVLAYLNSNQILLAALFLFVVLLSLITYMVASKKFSRK